MVQTNDQRLDMLETALEAAGMAWWHMEIPSGVVFFSPNKTRMLGRNNEDFFHYKHFTDLVHPDDFAPMMASMQDVLDGKSEVYETIYRIKAADGSYKRFYDRGKIVARKNNEIHVAGIVVDMEDATLPWQTPESKS